MSFSNTMPGMSGMANMTPMVCCSKNSQTTLASKKAMGPEFDYCHIVSTVEQGMAELPSLCMGKEPPKRTTENMGSQDYSQPPACILFGGGFTDTEFERLRMACEGKSHIPWLKADASKAKELPPMGPDFGKTVSARVKACLMELNENGDMEEDGVYYY